MDKKPEKLVPEVRFKGFTDDWEQHKLGKVSKIVRGASPRPIKDPKWFEKDSHVGWIRISDVTEQNGRIRHLTQHLSKAGETKTRVLEQPHLLLSIAASVGFPAINYVPIGVHDGFLIFLNSKFNIDYMFYWLEKFRPLWRKYGQPGSQINLNSDIVSNTRLALPKEAEQSKVSNFLNKVELLITLQQRKLNQLKRLKTAMLQQLLANQSFPKVRFNNFKNSWKDYRLGEVFDEFSVKSKRENEYKLLSSTTSGMESRSGRVSGHSNIGYKVIDNGDIVLSPQNLWLGNINLNNMGKGIVSPSYHTFKIVNANPIFVNFQLKTKKMLFEYKMVSVQGASVVRRNLDMDAFKKIVIKIPNEKEQIKIASLFSSISNIINNHQNKLTQLTTLKKYLLQKMFI